MVKKEQPAPTKSFIQDVFLRVYVRELVKNSFHVPEIPAGQPMQLQMPQQIVQPPIPMVPKIPDFPAMPSFPTAPNFSQTVSPMPQIIQRNSTPHFGQQARGASFNVSSAFQQSAGNGFQTTPLAKILSFLSDPSVFSVECPGPDKNVLVNRAGAVQSSQLLLKKEEVDELLEDISNKTRVPIVPGVFRAAYQNFIITAVVSEFVGTRFIIQKRMPQLGQRR